ncbi:MAG: HD-GYP domain-containing protein [Longimicrobiales bacterium]
MNDLEHGARQFLISLTKALSALSLYKANHPQRERAIDSCYLAFCDLQTSAPEPSFTFLDGEVALQGRTLPSLRGWEWGQRLAGIGMERIEILPTATREQLISFLEFTITRLQGIASNAELPETFRFGPVIARTDDDEFYEEDDDAFRKAFEASDELSLNAEVGVMDEVINEARDSATIHIAEVTAVVESLVSVMSSSQELLMPLIRLKTHDQYTATHSINVAVLSMALAEHVGLSKEDVRRIGIGGVLHDIGKTRIPKEVLTKPGKLTDEEFELIKSHPVEGARLIMESDQSMELAAVMAYEHHIRFDGGGYPSLKFKRGCHIASDLLHVCDVYDALATNRPYREGWDSARILGYLAEGSGTEFAPGLVKPFISMMEGQQDSIRVMENVSGEIKLPFHAAALSE